MHIHLDPLGGIAGDMFLAAAIDGDLVDIPALETTLESLGVGSVRIKTKKVCRGAIVGTHVSFKGWDSAAESDHRHLSTILDMLESSSLSPAVRKRAQSMFQTLGKVEGAIHGIPVEKVHFHECGALDSIFDFVSAAWIIENVEATWSIAPVSVGRGTVETAHGTIPVPVPAAAQLLKGFELAPRQESAELVTPTGATILSTLRNGQTKTSRPPGAVRQISYGAGSRTLENLSNVVRFFITETASSHSSESDVVVRLSCEIDDMTPELLAHTENLLLEAGALDVVREPVLMKKGRQGIRLSVLCPPAQQDKFTDLILRETTTFGLRQETLPRVKLSRRLQTVETVYGAVQVKVGSWKGQPLKAVPEYEDCAQLAASSKEPVRKIYQAAKQKAAELLERRNR